MNSIVSELTRLPTRVVRSAKDLHGAFLVFVLLSTLPVTVGGSPGFDVQGIEAVAGCGPKTHYPPHDRLGCRRNHLRLPGPGIGRSQRGALSRLSC
jgi:hypothetical protein